MTIDKAWLVAALALAVGVAPAGAADWGGIKNVGGGVPVPVPAPAPVPTFDADSDWYVGLAIGGNISQDATITDNDVNDLGASTPGHFARDSGGIGAAPIFGLDFGRYITPSLRVEVAIDYSPDQQISEKGTQSYSVSNTAFNPITGVNDTNSYFVERKDTVELARTTGLINLLYDIHTGTRFTPYVGGGFGFTWRRLQRNYTETYTCTTLPGPCSPYAAPTSASPLSGSSAKDQIDFAAAVQAGIGYEINQWITWDNGWQMLWEGGAISSDAPSASGSNKIEYKDAVLQQFRSGLRIKFD